MNILYEMHVYTMGTRSYAEAICNVVDPEGKFFGGRIISRDENRSQSCLFDRLVHELTWTRFQLEESQEVVPNGSKYGSCH